MRDRLEIAAAATERERELGISQNLSLPTSITARDSLARRFNVTQVTSLFLGLPKRARVQVEPVYEYACMYTRRSRNSVQRDGVKSVGSLSSCSPRKIVARNDGDEMSDRKTTRVS